MSGLISNERTSEKIPGLHAAALLPFNRDAEDKYKVVHLFLRLPETEVPVSEQPLQFIIYVMRQGQPVPLGEMPTPRLWR